MGIFHKMSEKFKLAWTHFETSTLDFVKTILVSNDFSDVTLVCEDENQIKVHKVILSACSPLFKNILMKNPHPNPLIFLTNITWQNLANLMQFVYTGGVEIEQENLSSFIADANRLQINGLADTHVNAMPSANIGPNIAVDLQIYNTLGPVIDATPSVDVSLNDDKIVLKNEAVNDNQSSTLSIGADLSEIETWNVASNYGIEMINPEMKPIPISFYYCGKCDYKSNKQFNVKKHMMAIHDGVRYPCDLCDYRATETGHLKKHKRTKHLYNFS